MQRRVAGNMVLTAHAGPPTVCADGNANSPTLIRGFVGQRRKLLARCCSRDEHEDTVDSHLASRQNCP
jgi:hypothetical protein